LSAIELKFAGTHLHFPAEENPRVFLLDCAEQYRKATGTPRSEVGRRAFNDPSFISQVEAGRNITIRTFETFMLWLDMHWSVDFSLAVAIEVR
jgi:hypothetical protein